MRILIVTQTYMAGNGQASFAIRLAEGLARRGHPVMVITPAQQFRSYAAVENGVRVERIAALHLGMIHPHVYIAPFPAPRVQQLVREFQPEVVHIQDHHRLSRAALQEARRGGIPVIGTNQIQLLELFENDPGTSAVLMIGEIGGTAEEQAAEYVAKSVKKPVAAFIAGQTAPPGRRMGHAGAIVSAAGDSVGEKVEILRESGVTLAPNPAALGATVADVLASARRARTMSI